MFIFSIANGRFGAYSGQVRLFGGGIIVFSSFFAGVKREFSGYNAAKLVKDILAGLTVCAVALPLALAFGVSSGATAAAGLVTAIIAGVVIALLGGASFQISGPTGAMSAVLVGIVAAYGLAGRVLRVLCRRHTAAHRRYFASLGGSSASSRCPSSWALRPALRSSSRWARSTISSALTSEGS